ncbi:hypothetical protein GCM10009839_65310 [Catenulispora yoronensis]|uniref:Transglutaminase-like domain-containing protein n=1 Tax=Catenulispora yoronensis TaxID=450799 RepID=A0ABP5GLZ6_9ACTN
MSTRAQAAFAVRPTGVLDHDRPEIARFVAEAAPAGATDTDTVAELRRRCRDLFYAVRDQVDYEVFDTGLADADLTGSAVLAAGRGFCLHKSILYATAVRHLGVPSRLVSGLVRNHLSSPELRELVGGEVFLHWYTEIRIADRWIKVTPVFNRLLCRMYGIAPLEFDGEHDAVYQPFDLQGREHMEFLGDVRRHPDPAPGRIRELIQASHPAMITPSRRVPGRVRQAVPAPGPAR